MVSQQRHQDVFVREGIWECVPQTNERGKKEKEREQVSEHFLGGLGRPLLDVGRFYTVDPEIPPLCVFTHNHIYQPLSFLTIQNSERFIGLTLNEEKREIYGLD